MILRLPPLHAAGADVILQHNPPNVDCSLQQEELIRRLVNARKSVEKDSLLCYVFELSPTWLGHDTFYILPQFGKGEKGRA